MPKLRQASEEGYRLGFIVNLSAVWNLRIDYGVGDCTNFDTVPTQ